MYVCGFILAVVTLSILYIIVRYRKRDDAEPAQTTGNTTLEIAWTAIPIGLVALLFVLSVRTAEAVDRRQDRAPDIVVTGHQWWWEASYPAANAITANEIHVPAGRDVLIAVEAADVIHDFWVPRLGRKVDAIPGRRNFVWIRADAPGKYDGACAEYCGAQHAWMRLRVVADAPEAFDHWLAHQVSNAATPGDSAAQLGQTRFQQLTCTNCHNIRGFNQQAQYAPDLTHVATRRMLAAERIENTPENLARWLREPNIIKPNCYMPNLKLSNDDVAALRAYLGSLR
jgi:cytochrome c oxidase subunit 2